MFARGTGVAICRQRHYVTGSDAPGMRKLRVLVQGRQRQRRPVRPPSYRVRSDFPQQAKGGGRECIGTLGEDKDWPDPQRTTSSEENDAKPANGVPIECPELR